MLITDTMVYYIICKAVPLREGKGNFVEEINAVDIVDDNRKQPTVLGSSFLYLLVLVLMLIIPGLLKFKEGKVVTSAEYYLITAMLEVLIVAVPSLLYIVIFRMNFKKAVRLNPLRVSEVLLVIGMAMFGYGVVLAINIIWLWVLSHLGPPTSQAIPPVKNTADFLMALGAIGLIPALVEEFMFRGVLLRGYERLGSTVSIILTGLLFGLIHLNLLSLPSLILLGIMISYVVYRTNSIWAGVIYHFTNNAIAVCLIILQRVAQGYVQGSEAVPVEMGQFSSTELIAAIIVWGFIGLLSLALFVTCAVAFHKVTDDLIQDRYPIHQNEESPNFVKILPLVLAVALVVYIMVTEILHMLAIGKGPI